MCLRVYLYVGCSSLAVEPVAKTSSLCCYFRDTVNAGEMMCYKCKHMQFVHLRNLIQGT